MGYRRLTLTCLTAARVYEGLGAGAKVLLYGLVSGKATPLLNTTVMFKRLTITYFNVTLWKRENPQIMETLLQDLIQLMVDGKVRAPVQKTLALNDWKQALELQVGNSASRSGKILFDMSLNREE